MNILTKIVDIKKDEVNKLKKDFSKSAIKDIMINELSFYKALTNKKNINLIAEIKKGSPSKGIIRPNFNYKEIAHEYIKGGADAISVLTDENFFMGNIKYLEEIATFKQVPILRKDFIIDEVQIYQAKKSGADAILLICEILDINQISEFTSLAKELGLDVLLELHSAKQLEKIDFNLNRIIGINNRNLETFEVNLKTTEEIKNYIPENIIIVSESGITVKGDIDYLKKQKINAVLVGEYFMRKENICESVKRFKEIAKYEN